MWVSGERVRDDRMIGAEEMADVIVVLKRRGIAARYLYQSGNIVYNRNSFRPREQCKPGPPERWIRKVGAFEPVISPELFAKAQAIIAARKRTKGLSSEEMLKRFRILLQRKGRFSRDIIRVAPEVSIPALYQFRFGSLRNAYQLISYFSKWN